MVVAARLRVFCADLPLRACALVGLVLAAAVSLAFGLSDLVRAWRERARPLNALAAAMRRVADGAVDVRIPGTTRTGDLGDMARALDVFRDDLVARRTSEAVLRRTNAVFETALQCMQQGMIVWGWDLNVQFVNRRYFEVHDLPVGCIRPGMGLLEVVQIHRANGVHPGETEEEAYRKLYGFITGASALQRELEVRTGVISQITLERTPDGGCVVTFQDVTEKRLGEQRLAHLAAHDSLTGLANRASFNQAVARLLSNRDAKPQVAMLCLDLDRFKEVNDTSGHAAGDALLRQVADRLRACMRANDLIARLGGDEFAVLMPGGDNTSASALATRIVEHVGAPYDVAGHSLVIGVSVGIALAEADQAAEDLLKRADVALYDAKQERGTWRVFTSGMAERLHHSKALEAALRAAVRDGEFELHYQPLLNLADNRIAGFEALLRWRQRDGTVVLPADFIPIAETSGLIVPIGEWALYTACAEAAGWSSAVKIAVNLSAVQFRNGRLVTMVENALAASGLAPERLELEITETVLLQNTDAVLATLHALVALGIRIAMDDFGSGYSSLSYLQNFPFDKIKIDRSFISALAAPDEGTAIVPAAAIVRAVAGLAASLNIVACAEGVESAAQLDRAYAEGCTEAQGYFISPPRPASEVAGMLARQTGVAIAGTERRWIPCWSAISGDQHDGRCADAERAA